MVYIGFFCSQHCIWAAQHTKNNKICANQWHLLQSSTLASQLTLLNLKMEYLFPPHPCMFIPCLLIWGGDSKLGFQFVVKLVTPHRRAAPHHTTTTPPTSTSTTITATELRRNLKKWISEIIPKHYFDRWLPKVNKESIWKCFKKFKRIQCTTVLIFWHSEL